MASDFWDPLPFDASDQGRLNGSPFDTQKRKVLTSFLAVNLRSNFFATIIYQGFLEILVRLRYLYADRAKQPHQGITIVYSFMNDGLCNSDEFNPTSAIKDPEVSCVRITERRLHEAWATSHTLRYWSYG